MLEAEAEAAAIRARQRGQVDQHGNQQYTVLDLDAETVATVDRDRALALQRAEALRLARSGA